MDKHNCYVFIRRKIKFFIQILLSLSPNTYDNIYITQNRILTESYSNNNKSLKTSHINKNTKRNEIKYDKDINNLNTHFQSHNNISTENDNVESLLGENHEEMKEINKRNEKTFFKSDLYLIDCLDNIYIDKLIDQNVHNKFSPIAEHVMENSVFLSHTCSIFTVIPILTYIIKRFDFLER
ncbi:exported protein (hyp6) [Plasmodium reichenowi]|uniref:Exported protein (Hyp6) n=1 Tax=Plasmodium reichenowi TaxID=5854 RepID=A0A151L642_PLARE|nr:exported protein (hyp6) [Plasmodium reichenowi]KYN94421.1 exported protein (hyp6) [Plasmodium reichenowi]